WLASRFVEVFGGELKPYALEAAIIYFGAQQHLSFAARITNHRSVTPEQIVNSLFHYMRLIINSLIHEGTAVLEPEKISLLKSIIDPEMISRAEVIEQLQELISNYKLTGG